MLCLKCTKKKIHFHIHSHEGKKPHFHAHSHIGHIDVTSVESHNHKHIENFNLRPFLIGLCHGAAGSAGLLALTVSVKGDPWLVMWYVFLFSLGSIFGMASLTFIASWPLAWVESSMNSMYKLMKLGAAGIAIWIGSSIILSSIPVLASIF